MRYFGKLYLAIFLTSALTVGAQGFVSPRAKIARQQAEISARRAMTRGEAIAGERPGYFFVNCKQGVNARQVADKLKALGAQIRVVRGDLILLNAPYSKLEALAAVDGVMKIDVGSKAIMKTDKTRRITQAAEVIDGSGEKLPQAYTGKGIIVGLIDEGFDFTHPMFKDKDGKLRIKGVYAPGFFNFGGDSVRINGETLTGSYYSKADDILDTLKVKDTKGSHGTHTASSAAGSMIDVNGMAGQPLGGMAPEADILLSISDMDEDYWNYCRDEGYDRQAFLFFEAIEYMYYEAMKSKKPLVLSMSLNAHDGWHDGTSNNARNIGMYAKEAKLPFILCASNEGSDSCYLDLKCKAKGKMRLLATPAGYVWGGMRTKKNVKIQLSIVSIKDGYEYYKSPVIYNTLPKTGEHAYGIFFYLGEDADNSHLTVEEKKEAEEIMKYIEGGDVVEFLCYPNTGLDQNRKEYTYTELYLYFQDVKFKSQKTRKDLKGEDKLCFMVELTPEEVTELNVWADNYSMIAYMDDKGIITPGDGSISIGDWNTSGEPVSVGAYVGNTKVKLYGKEGIREYVKNGVEGDIADFSSYGTDLAGHQFPDVCAPGVLTVAAGNSFDPEMSDKYPLLEKKGYSDQFKEQKGKRDYSYIFSNGTSMSTPVVAGIVALWMQAAKDKGKTLTNDDIKDIIKHTCDNDAFTKAKPERFGYGKINAYRGILYVLGIDTSIPTLSREQPKDVSFRVNGDTVYADGAEDGTKVMVYNLQGVNVRQTAVQGGVISLEGLPQGVYALQLGKLGSTLVRK